MRLLLLFVLAVCQGCVSSKIVMTKKTLFDKQGHRGCRGLMPENTIAAMLKAIDLDVTTLEMDAVITKDGEVMLSHEPFFNHEITTKADGSPVTEAEEKGLNIYSMSYAQTKAFDVGLKPHPRFNQQQKLPATKPLLREVIDSVWRYCRQKGLPFPQWNIETKSTPQTDNVFHPAPDVFVEKLVAVIREKGIEELTIIQSFDFRTLQYLHQHYSAIKTAMLIEEDDQRSLDEQLSALGFVPSVYSPHFSLVTPAVVQSCHAKGIKVIPWTVNDKETMEKLIAAGVDGLITDYPNLFAGVKLPF